MLRRFFAYYAPWKGLFAVDFGFPGLLVFFLILKGVKAAFAQLLIEDNFRVTAEHDIGTTAGHVRSHGYGAGAAGTGCGAVTGGSRASRLSGQTTAVRASTPAVLTGAGLPGASATAPCQTVG